MASSPKPRVLERRLGLLERIRHQTPLTLRPTFYIGVGDPALYPKTERGYKQAQEDLLWLRETARLPYEAVIDPTRIVRTPELLKAPGDVLAWYAKHYRQDPWGDLTERVAVTVESDGLAVALARQLNQDTPVPVYAVRGNGSATTLYRLADWLAGAKAQATVLHVGDADGQGYDIERDIRDRLRLFAELNCSVQPRVERAWLTTEMAEKRGLPGRPSKLTALDRKYGFETVAYEAEAGDPAMIADLVRERLRSLLDEVVMREVARKELAARQLFSHLEEEA